VRDTSQDAADGLQEAFLSEITEAADQVQGFPPNTKERDLLAWYMGR